MPTHSKNYYLMSHANCEPPIYYLSDATGITSEIPGYELMKAKLRVLDAKLMTMSGSKFGEQVWYIWDMRISDFVAHTLDGLRPCPFDSVDDAFEYLVNFHRAMED